MLKQVLVAGCLSSNQPTRIREESLESENLFSGIWISTSVPWYIIFGLLVLSFSLLSLQFVSYDSCDGDSEKSGDVNYNSLDGGGLSPDSQISSGSKNISEMEEEGCKTPTKNNGEVAHDYTVANIDMMANNCSENVDRQQELSISCYDPKVEMESIRKMESPSAASSQNSRKPRKGNPMKRIPGNQPVEDPETIDLRVNKEPISKKLFLSASDDGSTAASGNQICIKVPKFKCLSPSDDVSDTNLTSPLDLSKNVNLCEMDTESNRDVETDQKSNQDVEIDQKSNQDLETYKKLTRGVEMDQKTNQDSETEQNRSCFGLPQILMLNGKEYEIVQLGAGRWISRNEFELLQKLGLCQKLTLSTSDNTTSSGEGLSCAKSANFSSAENNNIVETVAENLEVWSISENLSNDGDAGRDYPLSFCDRKRRSSNLPDVVLQEKRLNIVDPNSCKILDEEKNASSVNEYETDENVLLSQAVMLQADRIKLEIAASSQADEEELQTSLEKETGNEVEN